MYTYEKFEELHETVYKQQIKFSFLYSSYDSSLNFLKLNHVCSHYHPEKILYTPLKAHQHLHSIER